MEDDQECQNVLLARKLAQFCPSSLSIDDLKLLGSDKNVSFRALRANGVFIPPSPSVSTIDDSQKEKSDLSPNSRFSFLFKEKKNEEKPKTPKKMKYELKNVHKLGTSVNNMKPVMLVSISRSDLHTDAISPTEQKKTVFKETVSTANGSV